MGGTLAVSGRMRLWSAPALTWFAPSPLSGLAAVVACVASRKPATTPRGDIVAYSYPRISLNADGATFMKPSRCGQHRGLGTHHEFHTALITWGAGVLRGTFAEARRRQIARVVPRLPAISPPGNAE